MFDFSQQISESYMAACLCSASASVLVENRFAQGGDFVLRTRSFETRDAILRKVQVGAGKSSEMRGYIAALLKANPNLRICFLVSTIDLGRQTKANLERATGKQWLLYRGIDGEENGEPLCGFTAAAHAAQRAGIDHYTTLCKGCPLKDNCLIGAQYENRSALIVTTHAMLRHGLKPSDRRPTFDLLVIDEDPKSTLLATETHAPSYADAAAYEGDHAPTLEAVVQAIRTAAKEERRLRIFDLPSHYAIKKLSAALTPPRVAVTREGPVDEARVAKAEARIKVLSMLNDLLDAIAMGPGFNGEIANCLLTMDDKGVITIDITTARDIHPQFAACRRVVVLSATAEPELLTRPIPYLQLDELPWQPYEHGKFVFVDGAKVSLSVLLKGGKLASGGEEAVKVISMLASRHGRVLLVCQQKVLAALKSAGLPDNVTTGHFNALEGLDNYAQFDAIIILGRPLAKLSGVIPLAEAAAGHCLAASFGKQADPNTLFVPRRKNAHTAKDGKTYTTRDYLHPNPHVDAVIRSITYGAVQQADRSRGQHRGPDNPVTIYDITGLDNVWEIDEVIRWRSLCNWFEEMEAMGFVPAPEAARGLNIALAAILPHWFENAKVANNYREYAKRTHGETIESQVAECSFRHGVKVHITVPDGNRVPFIVNANSAPEAETLIRKHLPPGTVIGKHACHKRRRRGGQPDQEENPHDDAHVTYELATGPHALDAGAAPARPEGEEGGCPEELVCEDGAAVPLRPCTR